MSSKAKTYIDHLVGIGEISFTIGQMQQEMGITNKAARRALERLRRDREIVSLAKGYYLILTPEFREQGCLPPNYFIDDLMAYWNKPYYVGLLSAAMFHGAAHQQPQIFQVMLALTRPRIIRGKVTIDFIQNSSCMKTPVQKMKTPSGTVSVSTPEATAMDLVKYIRQSGGINRVATVLHELFENIKIDKLLSLTHLFGESAWVQRLGFLLDELGYEEQAESLYQYLGSVKTRTIPLVPYLPVSDVEKNKKWRIAINAIVKSDLDDTY